LSRVKEGERAMCEDLRGDRVPATDPMHGLTVAIDEGIYPEILSQ